MSRILVVEDETELRLSVERVLQRAGHDTETAATGAEGLARLESAGFDLVLTDFRLPDFDGLEVLRRGRALRPDAEFIVMTAFANIPLAVASVKEGAYDFLAKPFSRAELERTVGRALERQLLARENLKLRSQLDARSASPVARLVGQSEALRRVLAVVEQVAPSAATVLLEGESGTGKELLAEAIHGLSPRSAKRLVKVNCAALPETLLEAELFGHERGAFTGALARREGRFAAASDGTLFLDEVATMSLAVQAKLLRVLQDGAFEPLGSNTSQRAACRIVAATNVDLRRAVQDGRFREDLFYRLNVVNLVVPPLRQRLEDVPLLAQHFLGIHAARDRKPVEAFSAEALACLGAYRWPGNVRELQHAIERAVVLARGRFIEVEHLPDAVRATSRVLPSANRQVIEVPVGTPLEQVERLVIDATLRRTGGNKQRAAALLGIAARTIYRKLSTDRSSFG